MGSNDYDISDTGQMNGVSTGDHIVHYSFIHHKSKLIY